MTPAFCQRCGKPVASATGTHPFVCENGHETWVNPLPVVVCLQPVTHTFKDGHQRTGLAIARRGIEPKLGTWCFVSGHVEDGENLEIAAAREWSEETNLHWPHDAHLYESYANGKGHVLVGLLAPYIRLEYWRDAVLCKENTEFGVLWSLGQGLELGFPIHKWMAEHWFVTQPAQPVMTAACYAEVKAPTE
jgi:hypothetical protein